MCLEQFDSTRDLAPAYFVLAHGLRMWTLEELSAAERGSEEGGEKGRGHLRWHRCIDHCRSRKTQKEHPYLVEVVNDSYASISA